MLTGIPQQFFSNPTQTFSFSAFDSGFGAFGALIDGVGLSVYLLVRAKHSTQKCSYLIAQQHSWLNRLEVVR
jgi:hypothetical protein